MAVIAGKVAPRFMGAYNSSTTYQFYDAVTYGNKLYFCKTSGTVGKTPSGATDNYWFLSLDGSFTDASELGGETAEQWQTKIDNIQTTSLATLNTAGWYRVAEYNTSYFRGDHANMVDLLIRRYFSNANNEYHYLRLRSVYDKQNIISLDDKSNNQRFTKARYSYNSTGKKAYLEVYYSSNTSEQCLFEVSHPYDGVAWKAITPTLTSETVDGVTVTTTYDIPANASPVTDLDLKQFNKITIESNLLEYALTLPLGTYQFGLTGSYEVEDLPNKTYRYGRGTIYRDVTRCVILLYGVETSAAKRLAINHYYDSAATWTGWETYATTADLANYLPKTGGEVNGNVTLTASDTSARMFKLKNSMREIQQYVSASGKYYMQDAKNGKGIIISEEDGTTTFYGTSTGNLPLSGGTLSQAYQVLLTLRNTSADLTLERFDGSSGVLGYFGFDGVDNPIFRNKAGVSKTLHHDGNSAKVVVSSTAPKDTTSAWLDTANKKTKAYIDGAWTVIA